MVQANVGHLGEHKTTTRLRAHMSRAPFVHILDMISELTGEVKRCCARSHGAGMRPLALVLRNVSLELVMLRKCFITAIPSANKRPRCIVVRCVATQVILRAEGPITP